MTLELADVTHRYPGTDQPALAHATTSLQPGITGLVGVNGAGKSTLLRVLSRGMRPTAGVARLDGRDLYGRPRRQIASQIALMPQDFRVPGEARVNDVLLYCAWLKGVPRSDATARARDVLERVGLTDRAHDRMGALSGGMVRRVALAQALISDPRVILLDEPTTGLDPEQRARMRSLLVDEFADTEAIVIASSHLMEDVEATADRVLLLHAGALRFAGSLRDFCTVDGRQVEAEAAFLRRIIRAD